MRATIDMTTALAPLVKELWPEHEMAEIEQILAEYITGDESAVFTRMRDGIYTGVALCGLRHDYVEGCETSPVGYLEGIFVQPEQRMSGLAGALCGECESWARSMGCKEFASDCELTNTASLQFHLKIGFTEENRIICFRKTLSEDR